MKNSLPVLVIGGGVAGISAALDIANASRTVHLVEIGRSLGGQVAKLDKLYPTDHCAFCPLWTDIKRLREHPLITVHTSTEVKELGRIEGRLHAVLVRTPPVIDESRCVFCGRCQTTCPEGAAYPSGEHVYPPAYGIERSLCSECSACVTICPTGAIDFQRADETIALNIDHVIWASGFKEVDLTPLPEFGFGTHPDIMTSLSFEEWTAEGGINRGNITRKTTGTAPRNIAFIQCAGARDQRMLPYCSAVCCMHALKQAKWVKRRNPAIHSVIFYTDLRTVGRDYYEYARDEIGGSPIRLIRGRPSLIYPLPGGDGIAVKFENTVTQKRDIWKFDMVVLNGNLRSSLEWTDQEKLDSPALTEEGFVNPESDDTSRFSCGFSMEPADVAESAVQAASVAARVLLAKREG
ncbi:MAG: 4Fe-4S binding protein [Deltaproteobacteria bacterium]|nr:4Fe-4S binding protein [Deltaproteobacteria bacterium]